MAKKIALLLLLLFVAACLVAGLYLYFFVRYPTAEQEEQAAFAGVLKLHVANNAGLIQVDGEDRPDVAVVANRLVAPRLPWRNDAPFAVIREQRQLVDGTLQWRIFAPTNWRVRSEVALHFAAPRATAVEAESENANVTVRGLSGAVKVTQTGLGTVVLEDLTGPTTVTMQRGMLRGDLRQAAPLNVSLHDGQLLLTLRAANPGPMRLSIGKGQATLCLARELNADLTYRTTGVVMDPFAAEKPAAKPGDGKPVTRRLGQGGAALLVEAEQADLTFRTLEDE